MRDVLHTDRKHRIPADPHRLGAGSARKRLFWNGLTVLIFFGFFAIAFVVFSAAATTQFHQCVARDPQANCEAYSNEAAIAGNLAIPLAALAVVGLAVMIVGYRLHEVRQDYGR